MDELRKLVDQWDADPEFALTDEWALLESVWRCAEVPLRFPSALAWLVIGSVLNLVRTRTLISITSPHI
jgi:hypothetical protein